MKVLEKLKKSPLFIYTVIFSVFILGFIVYFKLHNRSFIWAADGMYQHYPILYDFNELVRGFLKNPFGGINEWSFNIGYGADIIGTYSYYVLGDPFAYLSLLFPMDKLELAFNVLIVLRLYVAGLAFMLYAKKMKFSYRAQALGSISYALSSFVLFQAIRHPYFINPLIIIPFAFICVEYVLENRKKYLFSIVVAFAMISNFYFCYMIAIITFIYAMIRYFDIKRFSDIKFIKYFKNLFVYFIIGILISAVILLPTIYFILSSSRSSGSITDVFEVIYKTGYYINLILTSISVGRCPSWTIITSPIIVFMFLPLFIRLRKKYTTYFYMLIIFVVMTLLPVFGLIMNGFSSISNRWTLIFAFMASIIICVGIDNIKRIEKKDINRAIYILIFYVIVASVALIFPNIRGVFFPIIILGALCVFAMKMYYRDRNIGKLFIIIIGILVLNIGINTIYKYSSKGLDYIDEFEKSGHANKFYSGAFSGEDKFIKAQDKSFYRIGKVDGVSRDKTRNNAIIRNYNGIDSYLSVNNGSIADFSKELGNRSFTPNSPLINVDNRPIITDILGVKYLIAKSDLESHLNEGMVKIDSKEKFSVYENKDVLPFGYVYSNVISSEDYNKLNSMQKEESLAYSASVDPKYIEKKGNVNKSLIKKVPYSTEDSTVKIKGKKIIVPKEGSELVLNLDDLNTGNMYLRLENLTFKPVPYDKQLRDEIEDLGEDGSLLDEIKIRGKKITKFDEGDGYKIIASYGDVKKSFTQTDKTDASAYFKMDDIVFNLGYYKNPKDKVMKIKFTEPGVYNFDSIGVYNFNAENYKNDLDKLRENKMDITSMEKDKITGDVKTNVSGVLTFQIPYTKGWTVKIDGKKVDAFPVNTGFLGTNISAGNHKVELTYSTPFLSIGLIISVFGIVILILSIILERKYKNSNRRI